MRLYLNADNQHNIGYTPDWLKVTYNEKGQDLELTLDIRGEIDYKNKGLDCRCKGDLDPWVLYNLDTGEEIDLSELDEDELDKMFPIEKLVSILRSGSDFRIGLYPICAQRYSNAYIEADKFSNCIGECQLYDGEKEHEIRFTFEAELNLY